MRDAQACDDGDAGTLKDSVNRLNFFLLPGLAQMYRNQTLLLPDLEPKKWMSSLF